MKETVGINGLSLCHKHSDGWVRSTLSDVCKAPKKPVPFTNATFAKDLAKGTTTVFPHKGAMNGVKGPNSPSPSATSRGRRGVFHGAPDRGGQGHRRRALRHRQQR